MSNGINFGGGEFNSSTKNGWAFLVNALLTDGSSNVLSTPSILTLDNQEAEVVVGNEMSIETGKYTQTSTGATNPFTTYERKDVGVSLKVTPQIGNNGEIRLDILQEISGVVPNSANLQLTNKKKIKTQIQVKTGEAIALGGLISEKNVETESKVPLLGDIPFLGALFRYKVNSREKTNLVVFIRTLIVEDKDITSFTNEKYKEIATAQDKLNKRIYNWNNIDTQPNIRNLEKILTPPPELNK